MVWASRVAQQCRRPRFVSWIGKIPWRRDRLPTPVFLGSPGGSDSTESPCNAGDLVLIPGLGRSRGGGRGNLLQYSCVENPQEQKSLAGYSPCGHKESDTTERLSTAQQRAGSVKFIRLRLLWAICSVKARVLVPRVQIAVKLNFYAEWREGEERQKAQPLGCYLKTAPQHPAHVISHYVCPHLRRVGEVKEFLF